MKMNFKKLNRKLLSVIVACAFAFFSLFGVLSLNNQVKASAAIDSSVDITQYAGANYFNAGALEAHIFDSVFRIAPTDTGFVISSISPNSVGIGSFREITISYNCFQADSSLYLLSLYSGHYIFRADFILNGVAIRDEYFNITASTNLNRSLFDFNVYSYDEINPGYQEFFNFSDINDPTAVFNFVISVDGSAPVNSFSFEPGDTLEVANLALYRNYAFDEEYGDPIFWSGDYSPYFYSLNPEDLPALEGSGADSSSDDSSSDDSSSDDSSSDDSSSDDSSSDDSSSDDSSGIIPDNPDGNYQQGYLDGLAQAQYGFFAESNLRVYFEINGNFEYYPPPNISLDSIVKRIYGGYDFTPLYYNVQDYIADLTLSQSDFVLSSCQLTIFFNDDVPRSTFKLLASGSESVFGGENLWKVSALNPYNEDGNAQVPQQYNLAFLNIVTEGAPVYASNFREQDLATTWNISSLSSPVQSNIGFLNGLQIYTNNNTYDSGFLQGVNAGYKDGFDDGVQAGAGEAYSTGYREGKRVGYNDGFDDGARENNNFLSLLTAVIDAPVSVFTSLVDFNVLGFNLKQVFLSLLTVALVVCIISLFSKGKGGD